MTNLIELIKIEMVRNGRDDFTNYLAEILGVSKAWASNKLAGKSSFTDKELSILNKELDFEAEELKEAITR